LILVAVAVAVMTAVAVAYMREREARAHAEATQAAQQVVAAHAQQDAASAQRAAQVAVEQLAQVQADYVRQLAALRAEWSRAVTPAQVATLTDKALALPVPITVTPTEATIPLADFPAAKDYVQRCEECKLRDTSEQQQLMAAQRLAEQLRAQLAAQQQVTASVTAERDAWRKAAKGTLWTRLRHDVIVGAIGAGIGGAAICGTGHCK
jgi:hypothetical protein